MLLLLKLEKMSGFFQFAGFRQKVAELHGDLRYFGENLCV